MFRLAITVIVSFAVVLTSAEEVLSHLRLDSHQFMAKTHVTSATRPDVQYIATAMDKSIAHEVIFAVKQKNLDKLEQILNDVSDPDSPQYGNHWSWEDINELTRNRAGENKIKEYLKKVEGVRIVKESLFGEYLTVEAPLHVWEKVFATDFHVFEITHPKSKEVKKVHRAKEYSIPKELVGHIETVFHTVQFAAPLFANGRVVKVLGKEEKVNTEANGYVTPSFLNSFYQITSNTGNSLTNQAIFGSLNQTISPSDLTTFQTTFSIPPQAITGGIGGHIDSTTCTTRPNDCTEANLDAQYMMAVAQSIPTYYYYSPSDTSWLSWVTDVANMAQPYHLFSISYSSYEQSSDPSELNSFSVQAQKLGAVGTTLLAASGDDGVAGFYTRYHGTGSCMYGAQFPASNPYVTAVGGTMGPEHGLSETTCQSTGGSETALITTGGGFSDYYPVPSWQSSATTTYFTRATASVSTTPYSGYNSGGRGYPDISLLAHAYLIVVNGVQVMVDGTSASCPVFAGMVSLANANRQITGKPLLGWLNPALYQYATSYTQDITVGDNTCTAEPSICCVQGFTAMTGWDPVTGLGSVNYVKFLSTFANVNSTYTPTTNAAAALGGGGRGGVSLVGLLLVCLSTVSMWWM